MRRWPPRTPTLYLTFDDGPHPEETPRLLEFLDLYGIKATFFVIGRVAEKHPRLVRSLAEAGHTLGNHSMSHPWFNGLSMRQQFEEIRLADAVLEQFDGRTVHPFRPPHGRWTLGSLIACRRRSQRMVLWTHDSLDYRGRTMNDDTQPTVYTSWEDARGFAAWDKNTQEETRE